MNAEGSCNPIDMMPVVRAYASLGHAVQKQIDRVLEEGPELLDTLVEEGLVHPHALRVMVIFFKSYDRAVGEDEALWPDIQKWLEEWARD